MNQQETSSQQPPAITDSPSTPPDLSVDFAGLRLQTPLMTASGTSGYGSEYEGILDNRSLGAFITKSVTVSSRKGNPPERIVETRAGMLNAIGLANIGLEDFINNKLPYLRSMNLPIVVNVAGHSMEDYLTVSRALDAQDAIAALELNVSCPNVADGMEYGTDAGRLEHLVSTIRKEIHRAKLIVKLSPNVTDISDTARGAVQGGADALSLVNTFQAMAIDVESWTPMLANRTGGLSGPAIKPIALFMVNKVYTRVAKAAGVPILGMGGISNWRDAVEFLLAGATALAIGTALFVNPQTPMAICQGLSGYLERKGLSSVRELIGQLK